jgi:hypothetical protein
VQSVTPHNELKRARAGDFCVVLRYILSVEELNDCTPRPLIAPKQRDHVMKLIMTSLPKNPWPVSPVYRLPVLGFIVVSSNVMAYEIEPTIAREVPEKLSEATKRPPARFAPTEASKGPFQFQQHAD